MPDNKHRVFRMVADHFHHDFRRLCVEVFRTSADACFLRQEETDPRYGVPHYVRFLVASRWVKFRVRCLRQASRCDRRGFHMFGCVKVGPFPQKKDWLKLLIFVGKKHEIFQVQIHFDQCLPNDLMIRSWRCMVCLRDSNNICGVGDVKSVKRQWKTPEGRLVLDICCRSPGIVHTIRHNHQLHIFADTGYISGNCAREWVWLDVSSKTLTLRTSGYPQVCAWKMAMIHFI